MDIEPIKTKKDYDEALLRLELVFDAVPGSAEGDELEILGVLIDNNENQHVKIGYPEPIEVSIGQI